ncbi:MAG: ParB/RepB/Spo0J family partition protein [Candidatus Omnitrophica bacterium]|nr:ParB/RepB/Spo0J family partition protein [Candidatus Omnitrophota bacterium]
MEKKVLGRGLEALIPVGDQTTREKVQMIRIEQIQPSQFQPRQSFSHEKIRELAKSIKEKGVIQPVIVRAADQDNFELIAGERRLRAVRELGLNEIPAIVRRVSDKDVLEMSIVENIQREELNALEEAKAYRRLTQEFGLTQESVAERVGKDKSSVSNLLRILSLPEKVQDYLSKNMITFGHAKALLPLLDAKRQIAFCEKIIRKNLSVRQAEIAFQPKRRLKTSVRISDKDADIQSLEERLQHALGTKVRIQHGKKRGRIVVEYYSLEDLDRVVALLGA